MYHRSVCIQFSWKKCTLWSYPDSFKLHNWSANLIWKFIKFHSFTKPVSINRRRCVVVFFVISASQSGQFRCSQNCTWRGVRASALGETWKNNKTKQKLKSDVNVYFLKVVLNTLKLYFPWKNVAQQGTVRFCVLFSYCVVVTFTY